MKRPTPRRLDPTRPRDEGSATMLVLVIMTVLATVATVALTASINTLRTADRSEDWQAALAAAEAGVADYLARLHRDDNYWRTTDCSNVALRKKTTSSTCGWNAASTKTGWAAVPGSDRATFHYDVDITTTPTDGVVTLTSTGKVGDVTRSVRTRLRRDGFGEFLYYTKYETLDTAGMSESAAAQCARYDWPSLPSSQRRNSWCTDIYFVSGDVINGPLHSNDALLMRGSPRFRGTTTTSLPACRAQEGRTPRATDCYVTKSYSASPVFDRGIGYRAELEPPASIGNLRQYVDRTKTSPPGCLYTGPTRIKFLPTSGSATPKMQVWSRYTQSGDLNTGCGTAGTGSGRLGHADGQTVNVPQNNLILVQDVPSSRSSPGSGDCKVTGGIGDGLPLAGTSGSYPDYDINLNESDANCRYGTAYVEGKLKGRVTLAADNNIIVTDDLTYHGGETGTDALGLIANNSVKVYHPVKCTRRQNNSCTSYANMTSSLDDVNINAAILTLQHSFTVQQYDKGGKLDKLRVFGSIAQLFRGPVGTGDGNSGTGYLKDYNFDTRLRFSPPPYFLDPVGSGWGQKTYNEVRPRY